MTRDIVVQLGHRPVNFVRPGCADAQADFDMAEEWTSAAPPVLAG